MEPKSAHGIQFDNDWYFFALSVQGTIDDEFVEQAKYVERLEQALIAAKEKLARRAKFVAEAHKVNEVYNGHALNVETFMNRTFILSPTSNRTASIDAQDGDSEFYVLTCTEMDDTLVTAQFRSASADIEELIVDAKQWVAFGTLVA